MNLQNYKYSALSRFSFLGILIALPFAGHAQGTGLTEITKPIVYSDGRPYPSYRMDATDLGKFLVSPGHVVKQGSEYRMFFSSTNSKIKRTLGIARTQNLAAAWTVDANPALPVKEQIENSSLYFEPTNSTWFLFTNHIGIQNGAEFTDGIWVYWTRDLNKWDVAHKAVVLDGSNCTWSSKCIGMPSVTAVGDKLHIFYDAPGGSSIGHMQRSLGRATLQLPLDVTGNNPRRDLPAPPPHFPASGPATGSFNGLHPKSIITTTPKPTCSSATRSAGSWSICSKAMTRFRRRPIR